MMKLSEAIRLGSMMKPQAFSYEQQDVTFSSVPGDVLGLRAYQATCAFGAALDAHPLAVEPTTEELVSLRGGVHAGGLALVAPKEWMIVLSQTLACPACNIKQRVFPNIAHLNDDHRWTREHIADWIEQIELATVVSESDSSAVLTQTVE